MQAKQAAANKSRATTAQGEPLLLNEWQNSGLLAILQQLNQTQPTLDMPDSVLALMQPQQQPAALAALLRRDTTEVDAVLHPFFDAASLT